jgi:hypothetical protein
MVARLCLPMSSVRLDSNQTPKQPKYGVAGVCRSIDAPLP